MKNLFPRFRQVLLALGVWVVSVPILLIPGSHWPRTAADWSFWLVLAPIVSVAAAAVEQWILSMLRKSGPMRLIQGRIDHATRQARFCWLGFVPVLAEFLGFVFLLIPVLWLLFWLLGQF